MLGLKKCACACVCVLIKHLFAFLHLGVPKAINNERLPKNQDKKSKLNYVKNLQKKIYGRNILK